MVKYMKYIFLFKKKGITYCISKDSLINIIKREKKRKSECSLTLALISIET